MTRLTIDQMTSELIALRKTYLEVDEYAFTELPERDDLTHRYLPNGARFLHYTYAQLFKWKKGDKTFMYIFSGKDVHRMSATDNWLKELKKIVNSCLES